MSVSDKQAGTEAAYNARQETIRLLHEKGPKLGKVLLRLRQALSAKETKFFAHQGKVVDQKDVIAHNIRLSAVKLSLELHDAMPSQKHEHTGKGGGPIETKLTNFPKEPATIADWAQQVKEAEEQQTDEKITP